ncbi:MAG: hypothetical protein V3T83_02360 [Acidobacteriota bacterium]
MADKNWIASKMARSLVLGDLIFYGFELRREMGALRSCEEQHVVLCGSSTCPGGADVKSRLYKGALGVAVLAADLERPPRGMHAFF